MSNDRPETLEETQRRLAGYSAPRQPMPPPAAGVPSAPPPPPGAPSAPSAPPPPPGAYGPVPTLPPPGYSQPGSVPDPYSPQRIGAKPTNRRVLAIVLSGIAVLLVVLFAVAGIVTRLASPDPVADPGVNSSPDPTAPPGSDTADWENFPGSAYRDDAEVLSSASAEEVRDTGDAILEEYRNELTNSLGIVWTEEYSTRFDRDINGYGEESMLYSYDSALWVGEASAPTPQARQQIMDAFERITTKYSLVDFYRANDVYDAPDSISSFGAEKVEDQALWRFSNRGDANIPLRVGSSVWDTSMPTDPSFTGASGFDDQEAGSGKLLVSVNAYAFALLSENDRDAFIEALKPYEGLTKPDAY